jgi:hypothetical protein
VWTPAPFSLPTQVLAIDEADRLLEEGFEEEMRAIVRLLPKTRQTALFSATQTKKVRGHREGQDVGEERGRASCCRRTLNGLCVARIHTSPLAPAG